MSTLEQLPLPNKLAFKAAEILEKGLSLECALKCDPLTLPTSILFKNAFELNLILF